VGHGRTLLLYPEIVALHPLAAQFASVAEAYDSGRPDYAPAVVGAIAAELEIAPGAPVLDLAAGTGKLTRALLAAGLDVIAVEPLESLREVLAAWVGPARVRDGVAEAIPLADGSVHAVTVAEGFHWFDQAAALAEIGRVLRPRGGLAIVSMVPDWGDASWSHEVGTMLSGLRPEHPAFDGPPWQAAVSSAGGWTTPHEIRVTVSQPTSAQRVLDHLASMSWIAGLPDAERAEKLARIGAVIVAGETPEQMPVHAHIGLTTRV
jgi:SAM-dependent methyltransferase